MSRKWKPSPHGWADQKDKTVTFSMPYGSPSKLGDMAYSMDMTLSAFLRMCIDEWYVNHTGENFFDQFRWRAEDESDT